MVISCTLRLVRRVSSVSSVRLVRKEVDYVLLVLLVQLELRLQNLPQKVSTLLLKGLSKKQHVYRDFMHQRFKLQNATLALLGLHANQIVCS
jgi:hypothetical protein